VRSSFSSERNNWANTGNAMFTAEAMQNEGVVEAGFERNELMELQRRIHAIRDSWSATERRIRARMGQRKRERLLTLSTMDSQPVFRLAKLLGNTASKKSEDVVQPDLPQTK